MSLCFLCGCGEEKPEWASSAREGALPEISEAYENGWITKKDLKDIAKRIYKHIEYEEELDEETDLAIREDIARQLREDSSDPFPEAEADGVRIVTVYGHYSECYVVDVRVVYYNFPTDVPFWRAEIDGVEFYYVGYPDIFVCKID